MKLMSLVLDPYPTITTTSVVKQQVTAGERARAGSKNCNRCRDIECRGVRLSRMAFETTIPEDRALLALSRKEVIQPQVPLRLPCYDFAPVTALAFGGLALLAKVPTPTSGARSFHGVTGGVYKARERIHRGAADPRLLAIPASCSRVADYNPN